MTRCVEYPKPDVSQFQFLAILGIVNFVIGVRQRPKDDGGIYSPGQVNMPRHKICMKMGLQYILDLGTAFFSQLQIGFRLAKRVNDGRFTLGFYIVGRFGQTIGI